MMTYIKAYTASLLTSIAQHRRVLPCCSVAQTAVWVLLLLLTACADETGVKPVGHQYVTFEMVPCMQTMETRAWPPSTAYVTYDQIYGANGLFASQKNMVNKSVEVFFTRNDNFTDDNKNYQEGTFSYNSRDNNWRLSMDIANAGNYYVYGYIPKEVAASAAITPATTFSSGATLTINGLSTVTPSDVCVIVGAKEGTSASTVDGIRTGQFVVNAQKATQSADDTDGNNYIFLLFDHLYSALRFNFTVDKTYDDLRTIKLRGLQLKACASDAYTTAISSRYDATVSLQSNTTDVSPLNDVLFTASTNASAIDFVDLYLWDGVENTDEDQTREVILKNGVQTAFMGCFVPGSTYYFQLKSTYDVFDKQGNLIRKNCEAVNSFDLRNVFGNTTVPQRGNMYSLTINVQPTYLYMLSEPDLDNPTVKVE